MILELVISYTNHSKFSFKFEKIPDRRTLEILIGRKCWTRSYFRILHYLFQQKQQHFLFFILVLPLIICFSFIIIFISILFGRFNDKFQLQHNQHMHKPERRSPQHNAHSGRVQVRHVRIRDLNAEFVG